jgi:hypothetical protein
MEVPSKGAVQEWLEHPVTSWLRAASLELQEDIKMKILKQVKTGSNYEAAYEAGRVDGIESFWDRAWRMEDD